MKTIKELEKARTRNLYWLALQDVIKLIDEFKPTMAINSREIQIVELVKEELKARIEGNLQSAQSNHNQQDVKRDLSNNFSPADNSIKKQMANELKKSMSGFKMKTFKKRE